MNPYGVTSSVLDPLTGLSFLALIVGIGGSAVSLDRQVPPRDG